MAVVAAFGCSGTPLPSNGGGGGGGGADAGGGAGGASGRGGGAGGTAAGGRGGAGGACPLPYQFCTSTSGGYCSDAAPAAMCVGGQWSCPPGSPSPVPCPCFGPPQPGCVCTASGVQCSTGGNGGRGGAGGLGGGGGTGGTAAGGHGGAGGAPACADVTTLADCDARSDCHAVFEDPHNCACAALGCCTRFARCAPFGRAHCKPGATLCNDPRPYCETPYQVSYVDTCYEGCVRGGTCEPDPGG